MPICHTHTHSRHRPPAHTPSTLGHWSCARARTIRTATGDLDRVVPAAVASAPSLGPPTIVWPPIMRRTPIRRCDGAASFNGPHEVTSCICISISQIALMLKNVLGPAYSPTWLIFILIRCRHRCRYIHRHRYRYRHRQRYRYRYRCDALKEKTQ